MPFFTVDFFSSLDGNGSARGWPGYWGKEGPELREDRVRTFAQDQVLVFGATTFREFRKFVVEYDEPYYDSLNTLPKIVFSSTLEEPLGWQNSTLVNEDAVTAVDRLEVMVFPAITGRAGYASLFHDGPEFDLELVESTVLDGRTQKLVYIPQIHKGIPEGVGPQRRGE
jgi:hypothetical protein